MKEKHFFVAALALVLHNFSGLLPGTLIKVYPVLLLGTAAYYFSGRQKGTIGLGTARLDSGLLWFGILMGLLLLNLVRSNLPGSTVVGTVNVITTIVLLLAVVYAFAERQFQLHAEAGFGHNFRRVSMLLLSVPLVLIMYNLATFILFPNNAPLAVEGFEATHAVILKGLTGITVMKRVIPFSWDQPNALGGFTGAGLLMCLTALTFVRTPRLRKYLYVVALSALVLLLLIDSRANFFNLAVAGAVVFFCVRSKQLKPVYALVFTLPVLPTLFLLFTQFAAQVDFLNQFSRRENDLATGNSRKEIWENCQAVLNDFQFDHLWGYGHYGHMASGVADRYAHVTGGWDNNVVAHNVYYQTVFDMGYLGVVALMAVLLIVLRAAGQLWRAGHREVLLFVAFIAYFVVSGTSESVFNFYNKHYTLLTLLYLFWVVLAAQHLPKPSPSAPHPQRSAHARTDIRVRV